MFAVLICVAATASGNCIVGAEPLNRDPGTEVRGVFSTRCAGCHGPDLPKPKGRFGYVLDLRRVAGNPEMVIPGRPDESELWALVQHGEMPPADSPRGPLTAAEKETIRAWIAAGAPDAALPEPALAPSSAADPSPPPPVRQVIRRLGKFHLLLIHFPIALVFAAGVGELASTLRGARPASPAVRFCLSLAAVAVVPTVAVGWLHAAAGNGVESPGLLAAHRWLGTITGGWLIGTARWTGREARYGAWGCRLRRGVILVAMLLVIATAHLGGLMVHGPDFFD
jgi:hypothetical protein